MAEWKKNTVHPLTITGYTADGAGVARLDGRVVFVPHTISGEVWETLLVKVNQAVAWGKALRLLEASPHRVERDCPHAGRCGGCQYRHMDYGEELAAKGRRVSDALRRIGGVEAPLSPVLGSEHLLRYRNKVQFPVAAGQDGSTAIGFYRPRSHDVLDVEDCLLQPQAASRLRWAVKAWMEEFRVLPYREQDGTGLLRHLYVRTNQRGEALCCLVVNGDALPGEAELVARLRGVESGLVGVVLNVNRRDTNVVLGEVYRTLWGRDVLVETLCGLEFQLSIPSFFQVHTVQTEVLYRKTLEFAQLTGMETVLDLYCGIGTISLSMAKQAGRVIGAEIVPRAIRDAKGNADRNGIGNAEFFCGDAAAVAEKLLREGVRPHVVCVDPPRKGLSPQVPGILATLAPQRIVYVSCDPATLARDLARFRELGYEVRRVQPVDLFPRTAHVETIVLLQRQHT